MFGAPVVGRAQYLQDERTTDKSLRTMLTKLSDTEYLYQAQFRNEQVYDPNRVFGIENVTISGINVNQSAARIDRNSTSLVGPIYTGRLVTNAPGNPDLSYANRFAQNVTPIGGFFGTDFDGFFGGFGLLGCSSPYEAQVTSEDNGSSCALAGFTGWFSIDIRIIFRDPTPGFTAAGIQARLLGTSQARRADNVAVLVTPEPGTWTLMAFGLGALTLVRRKRRA